MLKMHGYIGKCPRKGCGHATREGLGRSYGECPDHGRYRLQPLWGQMSARKCNAVCMNATGPSCDCSCGGANHGANHGGTAQLAVTERTEIVAEPLRAPEPRHESVRLFEPAPTQLPGQLSF